MVEESTRIRLDDIIDAIAGIRDTIRDTSFEMFCHSWSMLRATERGLEIISEASRSIPAELKKEALDVPWSQIASIGNILRHEYQRVEPLIVWNIIGEHLGPLEEAAHRLKKIAATGKSST